LINIIYIFNWGCLGRVSKATKEKQMNGPLTETNLNELSVQNLKAACKAKNLQTGRL